MARIKVKAFVGDAEQEVEIDDALYIPREQHETVLEETVTSRLGRQERSLRSKLATDEEFVGKVLQAKGIDPKTLKGLSLDGTEVERLTNEVRAREVAPLTSKLTEAEQRASRILSRTLVAELTRELIAKNVKPAVAARVAKMEADQFGFDPKTEQFAMRNGEDFVFSTKATKESPYKGVAEFAEEWASDKENADFIARASQQDGPNLGRTASGASSVKSRADLKTDAAKSAYIAEHGFAEYQKLPATA